MASGGYSVTLIPPERLDPDLFDEPCFKLAAVLVRLSQSSLTVREAYELAGKTTRLLNPPAEPFADQLLFRTAREHLKTTHAIESFLIRLREIMPPTVDLGVANCERLLREIQKLRASNLQSVYELQKMQLPVVSTD